MNTAPAVRPAWVENAVLVNGFADRGGTPADRYKARYGDWPRQAVETYKENMASPGWAVWELFATGGVFCFTETSAMLLEYKPVSSPLPLGAMDF